MELTKKDKRHIEEEVRKLELRIDIEASEYAKLYKRTYLEQLKQKIDSDLYAMGVIDENVINYANNQDKF